MPPRRFVLLRHGEAATRAPSDRERPLTTKGRRDAERAGRWLAAHGHVPDRVLASPAARTVETARLAAGALGLADEAVATVDSLYLADVEEILAVLDALAPPARTTLLVGHNPGLSLLVAALVDDVPPALRHRGLDPASVVVVDVAGSGGFVGGGTLVAFRHPEEAT